MAVGPTLTAVFPNSGVFLNNNDTLSTAPRELTFRFGEGQAIDPNTVATGFVFVRSGGDNSFGPLGSPQPNDVVITPGFIGVGDSPREVVMRFASNLPDDKYRVYIVGAGTAPLRDTSGNPFKGGTNDQLDFNLDLGTKVIAIVPQPVTPSANGLAQDTRAIDVFFDQDELNTSEAQKPGYYRLINAATGEISIPQSVSAPVVVDPVTRQTRVTLSFQNIPAGTFKLEVGSTQESDDRTTIARHIGNSMTKPLTSLIGDSLTLLPGFDVDLYRFDLRQDAAITAVVTPVGGATPLDAALRIFGPDPGNPGSIIEIGTVVDGSGAGDPETTTTSILPAGTYYVGISAAGNVAYNPVTGAGTALGNSTGAYSLQVTFDDLPALNDNNSSFDVPGHAATPLGILGSAGRIVSAAILPDGANPYLFQFPGAGDAPGERDIPFQSHIVTLPGQLPDGNTGLSGPNGVNGQVGIRTITYDFQSIYGFDPQGGNPLFNAITENQRQRVREVLELYSRYLGVQFREVADNQIADWTIATGDPRAVAPTMPGGTGSSPTGGVNGIAGPASIPQTPQVVQSVNSLLTAHTGPIVGATFSNPIVITSPSHGLATGAYVRISGVQGNTAANGVFSITVVDQDRFALNAANASGFYTGGGTWTLLNLSRSVAVMNALTGWGNSEYGGAYFRTAMHEIGHLLGLGDNFQAPALTIMGGEETPAQAPNYNQAEPVFPGDADIVYGQGLHRPESKDIDLYQFQVTTSGLLRAETVAERLGSSSLLNTVLTLYRETGTGSNLTREVIARNDDYYGNDSFLELRLSPGTYYIGVTSVGNTEFDPRIADSGFGGRTQGIYDLKLEFNADGGSTLTDASGVRFDGDADGIPGGQYEFWFQSGPTVFVDKAFTGTGIGPLGGPTNPYRDLASALAAAEAGPAKIVRVAGNAGADGNLGTPADALPYLVGFDPVSGVPLADGGDFLVPQGVTVMIDAGAVFKLSKANLNAGTTPQGLVSRAEGSIQVLGTPLARVQFTSFADDTIGGDSDGPSVGPQGGDWGGIVFRDDSDHEADPDFQIPVYLNYVNNAVLAYGGGRVVVDSLEETYTPIHTETARPAISYNRIWQSADAAISADPNSFDDDGNRPNLPFDSRRIGPDIHDNTLQNNSVNGLFVRVRTQAGNPVDLNDLPTRWDDIDIVHVVSENVHISATPGGSRSPGADRPATTLTDGRLRIDPGVVVKLSGARIEAQVGGQFIAEGTTSLPIIFTSLKDDRFGGSGTFDTNRDGTASAPAPGQWGGLVFAAASSASLDQARVFYGGGITPVEGNFDSFNAVEVHQADARIVNSVFQFNDAGGGNTNRAGRGTNADATIFVRGAQPIIVNNIFRDNAAALVNINASALQETVLGDYGRSTGPIGLFTQFHDNRGPLVRLNRMANNGLNGMEVRGGTLTTETVWDDTDIAHILRSEITVLNHQVYSGLRLQSSPTASLVVKLQGANAGFTADGVPLDIDDRIGGTIHVIGQPGRPVILTSLSDDTIAAGLAPDGQPVFDTNNDGLVPVFLGNLPQLPASTGPLQVTYNTNAQQLASAMLLRPLPAGVTVTNATYQGAAIAAGTYINGDAVPLGIARQGIVLSSGNANLPATNTTGFFSTSNGQPGDPDLTTLAGVATFDGAVLTLTIDVAPGSGIRSAAFDFHFGSDEFPEFVAPPGSPFSFNDIFAGMINGGAATNFVRDSRGNLVSVNSAFFDQPNTNNQFNIEYDGLTSALTAVFPLQVGTNVLKLAIGDASDPAVDSGVLISDLRFSNTPVQNGVTARKPGPGEWRGIKLEKLSNDRNVAEVLAAEAAYIGNSDTNRTPQTAQLLGNLAPNEKSGDDNRRLGFEIDGTIAYDRPSDVDVYSFIADSDTEVWIDIDRTSYGLDAMVELIDASGNVLARATDTSPFAPLAPPPDPGLSGLAQTFNKDPFQGRDTYTTNQGTQSGVSRDPIMRVVLPRAANGTQLKGVPFFLRVRSQPASFTGEFGNNLNPGLTSGYYQLQVRLGQQDEKPGSTVKFADIRYAINGIEIHGLPSHSPLAGSTAEADDNANDTQAGAQQIGNLLRTDRNTLSVGGQLSRANDVDWYQFDLNFDLLQSISNYSRAFKTWSTIFDLDYADGLSRADATISVFDQTGRLILVSRDSDVHDDQGTTTTDLSNGSYGKLDPYLGPIQLPAGNPGQIRSYFVAVSSNRMIPEVLNQQFFANATAPNVRLEPIDAIARVATDHLEKFFIAIPTGGDTAEFSDNLYIDPNNPFQQPKSTLIDTKTIQSLNANIKPFTLADVPLFISSGSNLMLANAGTGTVETLYTIIPGLPSQNGATVQDLAFRSDGLLFGYESVPGNVANTAGRLTIVDTGDGTSNNVGNDSIPDVPATPPNPPDPEQITTGLFGGAAMAIGGTVIGNLQQNTLLMYAVPDTNAPLVFTRGPDNILGTPDDVVTVRGRASRLYRADPTNGSAAVAANQPWGRVRTPNGTGNPAPTPGQYDFINAPVPANASTDFGIAGSPAVLFLRSGRPGVQGNGTVVNFLTPQDLGPGAAPQISPAPASITLPLPSPITIDITLNSNTQPVAAQAFANFGTNFPINPNGGALDITATTAGAAGNNIRIVFATPRDLFTNGVPDVQVDFATSVITVTLDTNQSGGGANATTIALLANSLSGTGIIQAVAQGDANINLTGPGISLAPIQLAGGSDGGSGTTISQLVAAINAWNAQIPASVGSLLTAGFSGNANQGIAPLIPDPYPFTLTLQGGRNSVGLTTGMAFGSDDFTLYGVTEDGIFLSDINYFDFTRSVIINNQVVNVPPAAPAQTAIVQLPDPANPGTFAPAYFTALTRGPQNLENGRFADLFFAIATDNPSTGAFEPTRLVALDTLGNLVNAFDTDGNGQDDAAFITLTGAFNPTGLAFSPFDFNLWHPSFQRQSDPGHQVVQTPNLSSQHFTLNYPASGRAQDVNMSFYFGYEPLAPAPGPGYLTNTYETYLAGETGNASLNEFQGQFGELSAQRKRELSNAASQGINPQGSFTINQNGTRGTYNMPGGAKGSLLTDKFSLATVKPADKPTFYFDYFLDTEDTNFPIQAFASMRDAARVYIGVPQPDGTTRWDLVASNNSAPDSTFTGGAQSGNPFWDGEIPPFQSVSVTAQPENPRQQVQLLHDNTGNWRQARIDLSRYAGQANLQLRFDFTSSGSMNQGLFEDLFGDITDPERGQRNNREGFYVDNIVIGLAERGELVINAPQNTNFINLGQFAQTNPIGYDPSVPAPAEVLTGPYQLEIRRGTEYAMSDGGIHSTITYINRIDSNDRLIPDKRPATPFPVETFEGSDGLGGFNPGLPWSQADDQPWSIVDLTQFNDTGRGAQSGPITHGQASGLELAIVTGGGNLTFRRMVQSNPGDVLRLYIDGRVADLNPDPLITQLAEWSGDVPFDTISVPIAPGRHHIRWSYEKDASDPVGGPTILDAAIIDDIQIPTPQLGIGDIYDDPLLHDLVYPYAVQPPLPPTVPPSTASSQIRRLDTLYAGFGRIGDRNHERPQGHVQIEQNLIYAAAQVGILVDAGPREPGTNEPFAAVRNLPTLNNDRLVPGVTLANNIVASYGTVGIQFSGDANAPDPVTGALVPRAAVPFGRIINNTIFGDKSSVGGGSQTGTGILVSNNAGPTLMNNIIAGAATGIAVDASSNPTTVIGANLYAGNAVNGPLGTNPITLPAGSPLFVDPANLNFYPAAGSQAVDSSLNTLADRPSIAAVKSAVGIPQSPILAPDRDKFGQLRVDDPSQNPPPGLGTNIFKDRGAVERADFTRPIAQLADPLDNDGSGRDRNPAVGDVAIRNEVLTRFVIKFPDVGIGIDDFSVISSNFELRQGTTLLAAGVDYSFSYNPTTDEVTFVHASGQWPQNQTYSIKINNTTSVTGATGVRDLAGNLLQSNRPTGETIFTIFVGTLFDFGDAPAPYPSPISQNGAAHQVVSGVRLGGNVTEEQDALVNATATADSGDDGVTFFGIAPGFTSQIIVNASAPGFVSMWIDLNKDGDWLDAGEQVLSARPVAASSNNSITFTFGVPTATPVGTTFARVRYSTFADDINDASESVGQARDGEVEDYQVLVGSAPFQNPVRTLDVNNDGFISPVDALLVVNYLNAFTAVVPGNIPLPPTSPPFPPPAPVINPTGNGVPGQGRFLDTTGDGFLAPNDFGAVINFLNNPTPQGQGESAFTDVVGSSVAVDQGPAAAAVPAVLLASPDIVIEERPTSTSRSAADQAWLAQQEDSLDLALLAAGQPAGSQAGDPLLDDLASAAAGKDDSESWELLLEDLAKDSLLGGE